MRTEILTRVHMFVLVTQDYTKAFPAVHLE